ncbi:hypothetical protein B7G54_06695 [Burkholderia puraquae]|uniref:DUF2306 domain-containing protein n=1 Tax=Burkholderia puraquae TaxID=1904757 RepID=A0A1X1PMP7_9BURK|nr:DUF2306 domain-containing protein [Burkholderia puraquae]ORT88280.1 hypothetical protein B7G54_06695 [Burkholderia puraquae]CAB3750225.1 hypothetical protein LMG29660_01199 [Burkholderia puraquae]
MAGSNDIGHPAVKASALAARAGDVPGGRLRTWAIVVFVAFAIVTVLYGLTAIATGHANFGAVSGDALLHAREQLRAMSIAGGDPGWGQVIGTDDPFIWIAARLTSARLMFGENGVYDTLLYYARMPKANIVILSLHNIMGGTCMLLGALQFWPALRRNHPRWHRTAGVVYMVSSQIAMIGAMTYMVRTPVAMMYDTLTFATGLWFLALGVTASLWMSIHHLIRREIAQHQAYMAINYGFLLTAPFTRIDWIWAAMVYPDVNQNTSNFSAVAVLIAQCMLFGYLLLCMNRWFQKSRPATGRAGPVFSAAFTEAVAKAGVAVLSMLSIVALAAVVDHDLVTPGLDRFQAGKDWIPAGLAAFQGNVLRAAPGSRWLYAASAMGVCALAPFLLRAAFIGKPRPARMMRLAAATGVLTAANGAVLLYWGQLLGGPTAITSSGGTPFQMNGAFELFFAVLLLWGVMRERHALVKEWSLFAVLCVLALPSLYAFVPLVGWIYLQIGVPDLPHYVEITSVYRVAISIGLILAMLVGLLYAVYGSATQEKFAR